MRRFFLIGLLFLTTAVFVSAQTTVRWYQYQIEVADQVNTMVKAYAAEHPGVVIEPTVMADPYWDQLKVRAAALDMPDAFMTDGYSRIKTYKQYILDLTGDKLASKIVDGAKSAISLDGRVLGLPAQMSGFGIVYNKSLFEKAGVQIPKTYSELVKVCETLQAKGITPFVDQYKDNWVLGELIGSAIGKVPNPDQFVSDVTAGKKRLADQAVLKRSVDIVNLSLRYGQKNPMNDGWNEACTLMGQEKGAMMIEGIWVHDTIKSVNPDIKLGLMAIPFTDNPSETKLAADVNGVYHVLAKGKNVALVKDIFDWLLNTPSGQKFFLDTGFIPAYKGMPSRLNDVGSDANTYIQAGQTSIWGWLICPANFVFDSGSVFQEYILGKYNSEAVLPALDSLWVKLSGKK